MSEYDEQVPWEPPVAGNEVDILVGALERQRRLLAWKCGGLNTAGMRATAAASSMTLGGLLKHLALVEDDMFTQKLLGEKPTPPWDTVGWDTDPDWEWRTAADDTPEQLMTLWQDAVTRSRANLRKALTDGGLDQLTTYTNSRGESPSIRRLLTDMIEEYARHVV
jgi:hypothetical protein